MPHALMDVPLWLRLSLLSGVGPAKAAQLLEVFSGNIHLIFQASESQLISAGLSPKQASELLHGALSKSTPQSVIDCTLAWEQASPQHHVLCLDDIRYPQRLKESHRPPLVLYARGNLNLLNDPQLAMVGSRNASKQGADTAFQFAKHLSTAGITITSGLALGIDGASHEGALEGCASTVAVMATGIDRVYPAKNQGLAGRILDEGGVLITEFPLGSRSSAHHFPQRNRIIAGLSLGTLVVESALKSGSLITARLTQEMNREVFAIPGSIHNPMAKGCHQLIKQGAKLVETASDIIEEIAPSLLNAMHTEPSSLILAATGEDAASMSTEANDISVHAQRLKQGSEGGTQAHGLTGIDADHAHLLNAMGYDAVTIDELVEQTHFSAAEVASMLLIMELEGQVNSEAGGRYQRCQ